MRVGVGCLVAFLPRPIRLERSQRLFSGLCLQGASTADDDSTVDDKKLMFASSYHTPVMWKECTDALMRKPGSRKEKEVNKYPRTAAATLEDSKLLDETNVNHRRWEIYVDGTLGGGGHSEAVLRGNSDDAEVVLFGCDVDTDALQAAAQRLEQTDHQRRNGLFIPVHANFCHLTRSLLAERVVEQQQSDADSEEIAQQILTHGVDGILLDLGVSSYQINTAERGFAFQQDGPLDMRMNYGSNSTLTAADICNEMDVGELRRILVKYGDEPRAKAIADSIAKHRPLTRTKDLYDAVAAVTPEFVRKGRRMGRTASLARVFQSLRIVVNQEDVVLEKALTEMAPQLLCPGGRLVMLSYHSMEDRAAKRIMRDGTLSQREAAFNNKQRDMYGNYIGQPKPFRPLGKPKKASMKEIELNPRSRSATLRVAERVEG